MMACTRLVGNGKMPNSWADPPVVGALRSVVVRSRECTVLGWGWPRIGEGGQRQSAQLGRVVITKEGGYTSRYFFVVSTTGSAVIQISVPDRCGLEFIPG
jgi:hypothetical protein